MVIVLKHVHEALKARELIAERRINWARTVVVVATTVSMFMLLRRSTVSVSPMIAALLTVPPLAGVVFVWRLTDRYRPWMKYVVATMDVLNTILFYIVHNGLGLMNAKEMEWLDTRFLPAALVDSIDKGEVSLELGGVEQTVTVLMSDLRGFTSLSEGRTPTEVVEILNEYFGAMTSVIFKNGGTVDKFIGDAVLAVFGAPRRAPDDAQRAVRAAVEMQHALDDLNDKWKAEGRAPLAMGIGLHTGDVVAGNVGTVERMDYTVIGDVVNIASRIEGLTKELGAKVLLSETTAKLLSDDIEVERVGETQIRGRQGSVNLYAAMGDALNPIPSGSSR